MIKIKAMGGTECLYQWDTNRTIIITPTEGCQVTSVEFFNGTTDKAPSVEIEESEGVLVAKIPNSFLQSSNRIKVFLIFEDENGRKTIASKSLSVVARPQPAGYVAEPDEVRSWHELYEMLAEVLENPVDAQAVAAAVEAYMELNPVEVPKKTSDLQNDSDYRTGEQVEQAIVSAIAEQTHWRFEKAAALPEIGEENVIYLIPSEGEAGNEYEEYVFVNGTPELVGSTKIDLSGYLPKADLDAAINDALTQAKESGEFDGADGYTPHIGENGNWFIGGVDTGVKAQGSDGQDGESGEAGQDGKDGTSPAISVKAITGGHRITLTDVNGTETVDVMDGSDGQNGNDGEDGVGIQSIEQTTTSTADGGNNVITVTLTNGQKTTFTVKNGSKGSTGADGKDGQNGSDGYSPTVDVSKNGKVTTVTITDKNGEHTFTINDGVDGQNGADGSNGQDGNDGKDYVLTDDDKQEIAETVSGEIEKDTVKFAEQTLTEKQKEQARTNIGGASASDVEQLQQTIANHITQTEMETYVNNTFLGGAW